MVRIAPFFFTILWSFPIMRYLLYHRVAIPIPFGHPITFGGFRPNVCTVHGSWSCLSEDLKAWLIDGAGPPSWKHLIPREETFWAILFFVVLNLGLLVMLRSDIRNPQSRGSSKDAEKRRLQEVDAKLLELGDMEKAIAISGSSTATAT
jgi:hypothetical protein